MANSESSPRRGPLASLMRMPAWFVTSPQRYVGLTVALFLSQWALFRAESVFTGISGLPTPDTQNVLNPDDAIAQISSYTPPAVRAYELFAVIDYVFPLVAGIFLSATVLWLLRLANRSTRWSVPEWIALLCLLPALFDYVENIFLAGAVGTGGNPTFVIVALGAKSMKLASLALASGLLATTLIYALIMVVRRRLTRAKRRSYRNGPALE